MYGFISSHLFKRILYINSSKTRYPPTKSPLLLPLLNHAPIIKLVFPCRMSTWLGKYSIVWVELHKKVGGKCSFCLYAVSQISILKTLKGSLLIIHINATWI